MSFDASVVRVMISSPGDVVDARDAATLAIQEWNDTNAERTHVIFLPWKWETSAIPSLCAPAQDIINAEGVDRSDLVVAFFRSRLGSPSPNAVAGTVEEIERARAQGKSVHLLFSKQAHPADVDPDQLAKLREFRDLVKPLGLLGNFASLDELRDEVQRILTSFVDGMSAVQRSDHFERGLSDRVYEEVTIGWSYRLSATGGTAWDGTTTQSRRLTARGGRGLSHFTISLGREADSSPQFTPASPPHYVLRPTSSRSSAGTLELRPPRRSSGSSFAQDLVFLPDLAEGDSALLEFDGVHKSYKFAHADNIIAASAETKIGLRDWDFNSFVIEHPTGLLKYSVFLPDSLGATPRGPRVDRGGSIDAALTHEVLQTSYRQDREQRDGEDGWLMSLNIREPVFKCTYRLTWLPPRLSAAQG